MKSIVLCGVVLLGLMADATVFSQIAFAPEEVVSTVATQPSDLAQDDAFHHVPF